MTILVCEDDLNNRQGFKALLSMMGYAVLAAATGRKAIEICQNKDRPIDLFISDLDLPDLSGTQVALKAAESNPQMPSSSPTKGEPMKTILILDDEPDSLNVLFRVLEQNYRVLKTDTADEAIGLCRQHKEQISLIVADINLDAQVLDQLRPGPVRSLETILVVDDEEADRLLIRQFLQGEDYTIVEADDYPTAVSVFEQHRDSIVLLLADVSIPGGNGCDLAIALRNENEALRVLFVSGHSGAEVCRYYGLEVSDEHFLRKPFEAGDLRARVSQILHSSQPFPKFCDPPKPKTRTAGYG